MPADAPADPTGARAREDPESPHLDSSFQGDFPQQRDLLQAVGLHSLVHGLAGGDAACGPGEPSPLGPLLHSCLPT